MIERLLKIARERVMAIGQTMILFLLGVQVFLGTVMDLVVGLLMTGVIFLVLKMDRLGRDDKGE